MGIGVYSLYINLPLAVVLGGVLLIFFSIYVSVSRKTPELDLSFGEPDIQCFKAFYAQLGASLVILNDSLFLAS